MFFNELDVSRHRRRVAAERAKYIFFVHALPKTQEFHFPSVTWNGMGMHIVFIQGAGEQPASLLRMLRRTARPCLSASRIAARKIDHRSRADCIIRAAGL